MCCCLCLVVIEIVNKSIFMINKIVCYKKVILLLTCMISILTSCENQKSESDSEEKQSLEAEFKNPPN